MGPVNKREDFLIETYEGLISATARRFEEKARHKGVEIDDFTQILRIRVWRAIEAYDGERSSMTLRKFVFGCLTNQVKDVLKARSKVEALRSHRPGEIRLDELTPRSGYDSPLERPDGGDSSKNALRFLSTDDEDAQDALDGPDLPSSLTKDERIVALMLIEDYTYPLIAKQLGCSLVSVRSHISQIRLKMAGEPLSSDPSLEAA